MTPQGRNLSTRDHRSGALENDSYNINNSMDAYGRNIGPCRDPVASVQVTRVKVVKTAGFGPGRQVVQDSEVSAGPAISTAFQVNGPGMHPLFAPSAQI